MKLVDLSREIYHRMPVHPSHPPVVVGGWNTHDELKVAEDVTFSSSSLWLSMGDHAGTHIDAPKHFDAASSALSIDLMPLERFITGAVCLDLSHVPLKEDIHVPQLEAAVAEARVEIRPGDTVLLYTGFYEQAYGTQAYFTDFSGLTKESAEWLGRHEICAFGVEAISPGRVGKNNYLVHQVCRDMNFTHIEGLCNLDKLVGQGRFRFIGLPLKIKGGTGSPIRAVALLDK